MKLIFGPRQALAAKQICFVQVRCATLLSLAVLAEDGLEHIAPFTGVRMRFGDGEVMRYLTATPGHLQARYLLHMHIARGPLWKSMLL